MEKESDWKKIIGGAVLTGIITIIATLTVSYLSSKKDILTYYTQMSIPFEKDSLNVRIYNLDLVNDGEDVIKNVDGFIQFYSQSITNYKIDKAALLSIKDSLYGSNYKIHIASLNPKERLTMSFLISGRNQLDSVPAVNFRADGLSAEERLQDSGGKNDDNSLFKILLIGVSISGFLSILLRKIVEKRREDAKQHIGNQSRILAFLCGIHGLNEDVEKYLNKHAKVHYWSEADYFGNLSMMNREDDNNRKRLAVLVDLVDYAAITDSSISIIYYNIAKIHKSLGEEDKYVEFLEKSKKMLPNRISKRILIDRELMNK